MRTSTPATGCTDAGPCPDVFVRDLTTGSTTLVSRMDGVTGTAATGASFVPTIFPDGGRVIFASVAPNLSTQDTDECTAASETGPFPAPCVNVFVRDVRAGTTRYVAPGRHQVQARGADPRSPGTGVSSPWRPTSRSTRRTPAPAATSST